MEVAAPVFWGGALVLFLLTLYRTGWNFRESILKMVGLRGFGDLTTLELVVWAATMGGTFYVFFQVLEACKDL